MAQKKGQTKRQHYVPQFILRSFSKDEKNTSVLVMKDGRLVPSGPVKNQCYEDYFYGEDQIMEKSFARSETTIGGMLGDLSAERLESLSDEDIDQLKLFVHYQMYRTRAAVEQCAEFKASFVRHLAAATAKMNGEDMDRDALDNVRLVDPNGVNESIWLAAKSSPALRDLEVKFLATARDVGFVVADHPVVACNQFAEHHPILGRRPNITAPVSKGIQIFMPLSPSVTLNLYDPGTYEFDVKRRVCNVGPRDVHFLNRAQAVSTWECLFFHPDRVDTSTIESLIETKRVHPGIHRNQVFAADNYEKASGGKGQLVAVVRNDIRVGARFSFLRVTDRESYKSYDGVGVPYRSEELVDFLECYGEILERVGVETRNVPGGYEGLTEAQFKAIALAVVQERSRRDLSYPQDDIPSGLALSRV